MDKESFAQLARDLLREQIRCIGRVAARHRLPDDAVWELAKGFDVLYQRVRRQLENAPPDTDPLPAPPRAEPHPGLTYLLDKLDREEAGASETGTRKG